MDDVLITGAAGRAGNAIIDHLPDYEFVGLDRSTVPEIESYVADVTDENSLIEIFGEYDTVIHLAANPSTQASWEEILQNNIIGTYSCLEAASVTKVESVIFASSNHVVGMYEQEHAPAIYQPNYGLVLDHKVPIRPDSYYGTSKAFGEAIGRQYIERRDWPKRFYSLRIGSLRSPEYDHPFGDAERGVEKGEWQRGSPGYQQAVERMKATWLSRLDFAHLIEQCLRDDDVEFDIFYGVSDNESRWFDLEHPRSKLGYRPVDQAEQYDEPPV